ncbi:MAG: C25 family cysteine peptidase [Candidatus Hodarchaeota archaeon]
MFNKLNNGKTQFKLSRTILFFFLMILPFSQCMTLNANNIQKIAPTESIDYLIITSESFFPLLQPFALWKVQRGLSVAIVTVEDIIKNYSGRDTPESIRNCIKDLYKTKNLQWVLLAGNDNHVPTRSVKTNGQTVICDQYYSILHDNWHYNSDETVSFIDYFDWETEVYIGRLPAENAMQMELLINRTLKYENSPPVGSWMKHALFAGAFASYKADVNQNDEFDNEDQPGFDANRFHNWLNTQIIPEDWSSTLLAEDEGINPSDSYYDKPLNEEIIAEEINKGATICNFDAHGSATGMFRYIFSNDEDKDGLFDQNQDDSYSTPFFTTSSSNINTEGKNGLYFLCACSTGDFDLSGVGLAEYVLYNCGIGCIASSRSAYYEAGWIERDHAGWRTQGLSGRFWKHLLEEKVAQPGKAFIEAKKAYVSDFISFNGPLEQNNQTLIQYNLLGDPEVPIWTDIPSKLELDKIEDESYLILEVKSNNQPVNDVTVTILNSTYNWVGMTNNTGQTIVPVSSEDLDNLTLTLTKPNFLPYQEIAGIPIFTKYNLSQNNSSIPFPSIIEVSVFIILMVSLHAKKRK